MRLTKLVKMVVWVLVGSSWKRTVREPSTKMSPLTMMGLKVSR